jgi:hypothetical protein
MQPTIRIVIPTCMMNSGIYGPGDQGRVFRNPTVAGFIIESPRKESPWAIRGARGWAGYSILDYFTDDSRLDDRVFLGVNFKVVKYSWNGLSGF